MALVLSNEGEEQILNIFFGKISAENLVVKLYTNDYTPVEASVPGSFTEHSTFGYTAQTVLPAAWTITPGDPTYGTTADVVFSFTGAAGNTYGYYIVGATSGKLYWAERFGNGVINIQNINDQIRIPLKFGLE